MYTNTRAKFSVSASIKCTSLLYETYWQQQRVFLSTTSCQTELPEQFYELYFQSVKVLLCVSPCVISWFNTLRALLACAHRGGRRHIACGKKFTQAHDFSPFYSIPSDVGRAVHAPAHITEKVVQLFRSKSEFTFLASIQQKSSTSGVIFSIHESEHR